MSTRSFDIVIVGGGVIGAGIAYELARQGRNVALLDRGPIGHEASWASAGIISLPGMRRSNDERVEIVRRSLATYPDLVAELETETGLSIEYRQSGELRIAVDETNARLIDETGAWHRKLGFDVAKLDNAAARDLEPSLPDEMHAVWFASEVGALRLHRLTLAFATAAANYGATVLPETPVSRVAHSGGQVTGVELAEGDLPCELVVLAAGAWTKLIAEPLDISLPTRPVKGQLVAFANPPLRPRHVIEGHGGYVVPCADGTILLGATEEEAGFDRRVTGEGIDWLLNLASTLCPTLPAGELVEMWTGLRPGSADGLPMVGPVPGFDGLWVASGHFRSGATEAPATVELMASSITSGTVDPLLIPFSPDRFQMTGE